MYKKLTIFFTVLIILVINYNIEAQPTTYAFDGAFFRYGTIDLNSGAFTSLNFLPQGNDKYPVSGDNDGINGQYTIMANFSLTGFYLYHLDFVSPQQTVLPRLDHLLPDNHRLEHLLTTQ
ncbi:MAG: hypothetical protein IPH11_09915 [Ignavibacteriales bacterium]|nr:hypothetical protein [Ignavibacteriales bacterium]